MAVLKGCIYIDTNGRCIKSENSNNCIDENGYCKCWKNDDPKCEDYKSIYLSRYY